MKIFIVFMVVFGFCHCATVPEATVVEGETEEPQLCPEVIRYNVTFWKDHFGMKYEKDFGVWWVTEYVSDEETTDLPPLFPEGESRPFAMHAYMLLGKTSKMWLVKYPTDQIIHWYQGDTARLYIIDPKTGALEKRILNARNVVTVVEAGYWVASDVRSSGEGEYVLLGCTMVPGVITGDMNIAKTGDVSSPNKQAQRTIIRFTKPTDDVTAN